MSESEAPEARRITQVGKEGGSSADPKLLKLTRKEERALQEYIRMMTENVIPEIVQVVEDRQKLARLSRQWPLTRGKGPS